MIEDLIDNEEQVQLKWTGEMDDKKPKGQEEDLFFGQRVTK
jgi:hypothetical protein